MNRFCGFSKLSKDQKIDSVVSNFIPEEISAKTTAQLKSFCHQDGEVQELFDKFSENTISNFNFPYGVVPNLLMNGKSYCVPMVIEESSVVAAASKSAKFWRTRGGFHSKVLSIKKIGQVHMIWHGEGFKLFNFFETIKKLMLQEVSPLIKNMENRGGGILELKLVDRTQDEPGYYQLMASFDTCDAMGANFINSVLEAFARIFKSKLAESEMMIGEEKNVEIIMAILSNYTPECLVKSYVECSVDALLDESIDYNPEEFVRKFKTACQIAKIDVGRAVTHNKGIFNGIDAVVLATGNDFRAVEASGHAYAARDGQYRGLTSVEIKDGVFKFSLTIPLSVGTVGGLTALHPLAKISLDLLGRPSATELMMVIASIGLAQNFAALRSLVTTGIQKGHMKMHLINILNQLQADRQSSDRACEYFAERVITYTDVRNFINSTAGETHAH